MKTYFIFLCLLISGGLASATTQTTVNQDKPAQLYIKSYKMSDSGSYNNTYDPFYGNNNTITFSANVPNWSDGSAGTASWMSHLEQTGEFWNYGLLEPYDDTGDFSVSWNWPAAKWPNLSATESGTYNYVNSPGPSPYGSGSYTYSNQPAPVFMEHCDIGISTNYLDDDVVFISENRSAQTTVKLRTGGKATSKLRNLFGLTAGANQISPNNPYDVYLGMNPIWSYTGGSGYLFERVNGAGISSQSVTVGSYGNLNTNGVLYKSLPDNADVDVTPYVANEDDYSFSMGQPQKYNSYFDLYVEQANPGYSLLPSGINDVGHTYWRFRTEAPNDALQYISTNLNAYMNQLAGFFPSNSIWGTTITFSWTNGVGINDVPGQLKLGSANHDANIKRIFYIGFNDLLNGLEYTRGLDKSPPAYVVDAFNCVGAARGAGFSADVFGLPWDMSPQNFGVSLIQMYPPVLSNDSFDDEADIFYSSAPY